MPKDDRPVPINTSVGVLIESTYGNRIHEEVASRKEHFLELVKETMRLFDHWKLSTADQLELLGLSANSRRMLTQYRKDKALPSNRDMQDRLGWLMVIHQDLRTLYPENPELCYSWVSRRSRHLDNLAPIEVMKEQAVS